MYRKPSSLQNYFKVFPSGLDFSFHFISLQKKYQLDIHFCLYEISIYIFLKRVKHLSFDNPWLNNPASHADFEYARFCVAVCL